MLRSISAADATAPRIASGSDPAFLLDCLYSDDESTRNSAAGSLEKILSRRVAVEPNADMKARTAVIDRHGRVRAIHSGSDWTPETLVAELRDAVR